MNPEWLIAVTTVILGALLALGMDMRKDNRRMREQTEKISEKRHLENQIELSAIKTQLKPIADWWNYKKRNGETGD